MANEEICWPCRRGQHMGCVSMLTIDLCECDHKTAQLPMLPTEDAPGLNLEPQEYDSTTTVEPKQRRLKNDDSVTDQQSTGRKRAAKMYPLIVDGKKLPCDFANKKNALPNFMEVQIDGCGVRPGTMPNPAQARHHHDYNTLNNERANLGLLCHSCHNLLHARNDAYKDAIYERIYGYRPAVEDLKHANKALKSGVVGGGQIEGKDKFGL